MSYNLVLDVETTIGPNKDGNPFTKSNRLCLVGLHDGSTSQCFDIEYSDSPYGSLLLQIKELIEGASLLIGFNLKFDLHWIRRYVPDIIFPSCFDCQLAEFILNNQRQAYPGLDDTCESRGLGRKLDVVHDQFWSKGIDTPQIPLEILQPYLEQDLQLTWELFQQQREELSGKKRRLFWLQCQDLLVLQEMEWNGLKYNTQRALERGKECQDALAKIDAELHHLADVDGINFNSPDHVSCLLYGGVFYVPYRETYLRTLKDGTVKEQQRWAEKGIELPRLCKPLEGSEGKSTRDYDVESLAAETRRRLATGEKPLVRHWSTGEPVLRRLKATGRAKRIIRLLLERSKLEKLDSTYYTGLVEDLALKSWEPDTIHGNFNQSVARTGRLSSSKPNLQNFAGEIKELFYSRYAS